MKRGLGRTCGILLLAGLMSGAATGCLRDTKTRVERERRESFDMLTRAQRLKAQGDYLLARDLLLEAAEVSPRPVVFYEIGNCYYQLGNLGQAEMYYERALAIAPEYALAQAELDLVRQSMKNAELEQPPADRLPAPEPELVAASPTPTPVALEVFSAKASPTPTPTPVPEPTREVAQATTTPTPTPTPAAERVAEVAQATTTPTPTASPAQPFADETPRPTTAPSGPLSGLTGAFSGLGTQGTPGAEAAPVDPEAVREALFPELYSNEPVNPETVAAEGRDAERLGHFDRAVREWSTAVSHDPNDIDARLRLAHALYRSGRSRRAEQEYRTALRIEPKNPEIYFEQGNFYVQSGDRPAARRSFREALIIKPDHLRARNNLGALEMQLGNNEDAVYYLNQVVEAEPTFASGWLNLALAQDNAGYPAAEVLQSLERYQRLSPGIDARTERWLQTLERRAAAEK